MFYAPALRLGADRVLVVALRPEPRRASEAALAEDWNRPEEDAAWLHLQSAR